MKKAALILTTIISMGYYANAQDIQATVIQDPANTNAVIIKVKNTSLATISGDITGIVFSLRIPETGSAPTTTVTKLIPDGTGSVTPTYFAPYSADNYLYYDYNIDFSGNNPFTINAGEEKDVYNVQFNGVANVSGLELVAKQFDPGTPNATGPNNSTEYSFSVGPDDHGDGTNRFYDNGTGTVSNSPELSIVGIDAPLAISYSHIEAKKQGSTSLITWGTATESNNQGFTVERSGDGKSFEKVGFVSSKAAGGNSTSALEYAFTDAKPLAGINYYRLQQTNADGKYEYSKVVSVTFDNNNVIVLYPNPARDYATIKGNGIKSVLVYDISGKNMSLPVQNDASAIRINTSTLSNGIYNIRIEAAGGSSVQKLVVQH